MGLLRIHSARDFFARECRPERVRELMATETAFDAELWQTMADQGFTGLTIPQAAEALGISARTADRTWAYARAWLFRRISGEKLA